jgi:intracellular multiplication protein IcmK
MPPKPKLAALLVGLMLPALAAAQQTADAPAPPTNPAADKAMQDAIPLTPEMIRELGRRYGEVTRAKEDVGTESAMPVNRRIHASFVPGQATSIIHTVKGYPSALSFFDSTGQPWPIAWETNSNPAGPSGGANCNSASANGVSTAGGPAVAAVGFTTCTPVKGSNVLEITPMSLQPRGGLLVTLEGAPKPLSFLLIGGGGQYDADLSVQVADRGPNAKLQIITQPNAPDTGAPFLTGMLEGVPPADAVPQAISGVSPDELRAWRLGDHVFLRTRYTLLSPEWTASESGEGGLTVYALPATPVVLLSVNGRTTSAALQDQ